MLCKGAALTRALCYCRC